MGWVVLEKKLRVISSERLIKCEVDLRGLDFFEPLIFTTEKSDRSDGSIGCWNAFLRLKSLMATRSPVSTSINCLTVAKEPSPKISFRLNFI